MTPHTVSGLYAAKGDSYRPPRRVGPSGLFDGIGKPTTLGGKPALLADIEAYGKAVINAKVTGFDGVEFHAAHRYLLDQSFQAGTNKREDLYSGTLGYRVRLATDVNAEIRRMTGPDFAISLRNSQWKVQDCKAGNIDSPEEPEAFARIMVDVGVDVFHCSARRYWENEFGSAYNLAAWTKTVSDKPTITVGSIGMTGEHIDTLMGERSNAAALDHLLEQFERGDFDLVAVGCGMLVNAPTGTTRSTTVGSIIWRTGTRKF